MIRGVIADMDAVLVDVRAAIDGLDEVDLASQDVAIEIARGLEKDRWFLFAHLAGDERQRSPGPRDRGFVVSRSARGCSAAVGEATRRAASP